MSDFPTNPKCDLLTADNSVVVLIDCQPQMTLAAAGGIDRQQLINNVLLLAKGAKLLEIPIILTTLDAEVFNGYLWPQLMDVFPSREPVERSVMNAWDSEDFRAVLKATGRRDIILAGLWTEIGVCWPALGMLDAGYNVYVVEDACGGTSPQAHEAAVSRMMQAGAVRITAVPAILELRRDWTEYEQRDALLDLLRDHAGAYGVGIEYASTMVHKAPQGRRITA